MAKKNGAPVVSPRQQQQTEEYRRLMKEDFVLFSKTWLRIIDRDSPHGAAIIPLELNACQKAMHKWRERVKRFNLANSAKIKELNPNHPISIYPIKGIFLKARKMGVSTLIEAWLFHRCEFEPHTDALVMSHQSASALNISSMMRRFHTLFPDPQPTSVLNEVTPHFRQEITHASPTGDSIRWNEKWGSKVTVHTAGSKRGASRSFTYHFLHVSEEAHYEASDELSSAMNAAVKYSESYEESTANGEGNVFHENWEKAMWIEEAERLLKKGEQFPDDWNGRFRFFWGWHQDPAYREPLREGEDEAIMANLDEEEEWLVEEFEVDASQLKWRRKMIAGPCSDQADMDALDYFHQEYPATPEQAFVSKGNTFFDQPRLVQMRQTARELTPKKAGRWHRQTEGLWAFSEVSVRNSSYIEWEHPKDDNLYIIGADAAEGRDGDNSVISIWRRISMQMASQVAQFRGKIDGHDTGELAVQLAKYYNMAFIVPERSGGAGSSMCRRIFELNYPHVYHTENPELIRDNDGPDSFSIGYRTTQTARRLILDESQRYLKDDYIFMRSIWSIQEWKIFQNINGKPQAPAGKYDDCVIADSLALSGHFQPEFQAPPLSVHLRNLAKEAEALERDDNLKPHDRAMKKLRKKWERQHKTRSKKEAIAKMLRYRKGDFS